MVSVESRRLFLLITVISALTVGTTALTRYTGDLFPWVPMYLLTGASCLLAVSYSVRDSISLRSEYMRGAVLVTAGFAVAARLLIMSHPHSLIGIDPDRFAAWAHVIQLTGRADIYSPFYSKAPLFHMLLSIVSTFAGIDAFAAMNFHSVALGVTLVLIAAVFAKRVTSSPVGVVLAFVLAAILASGLRTSYWPTAQALGNVYLFAFLALLAGLSADDRRSRVVLMGSFAVGMVFIHKLPLFVAALITIVLWGALRFGPSSVQRETERDSRVVFGLSTLFFGLLLYQWAILTTFIEEAIDRFAAVLAFTSPLSIVSGLLFGGSGTAAVSTPGGVPPSYGAWVVFQLGSFQVMVTLLFGAVAWLFVAALDRPDYGRVVLLVSVGVLGLLVGAAGVSGFVVSISRIFWTASLPLVVLIAYAASRATERTSARTVHVGVTTVILALLLVQTFSAAAVPNYPESPRYYLDQDESQAKEFGHRYVEPTVHADGYLAGEITNLTRIDRPEHPDVLGAQRGHFQSYDTALFQKNLTEQRYPVILYRNDLTVYRAMDDELPYSIYRLTYDPEPELKAQYDRVYDSGGTSYYSDPGASNSTAR